MKNGSFTVKLEFAYDADTKEIKRMEVLEINGAKGEKASYVQSTKDTYLGTIGTTIILTKSAKEDDPCAWVWNPTLRRWVWRCWNSDDIPISTKKPVP